MLIEIKGVGFVNKGAALMMLAVLDRLRAELPEAQFTIAPRPNCPYERLAERGIYPKLWYQRYRIQWGYLANWIPSRLLRRWGLISDAEIDAVLDASGFAYGDQWGAGKTVRAARAMSRWKKQGTKVILLPQAFGPFTNNRLKKAFRTVVDHADAIYPRDEISHKHITELVGSQPHIKQAPDFTVLVQGKTKRDFEQFARGVAIIPNSKMMDKTSESVRETYLPFLATCADYFIDNAQNVFFLIHEGPEDEKLARQANRMANHAIPILVESDPRLVKGIIGRCKAVVSSRYHGLINAFSQGVPAAGTGWSHKYQALFDYYGAPEMLLSPTDPENKVKRRLKHILERHGELSDTLDSVSLRHRKAIEDMWKDVLGILAS